METLSHGSAPCCQLVNSKWKSVDKSLNSCKSRVSSFGNHGVDYNTYRISICGSVRFYDMVQQRDFRSQNSVEGLRRIKFKVYSGSYDGYVIGEEEARDISGLEEHATKVLIPGLPDESNGESGASISSCFREWKPKLNIHYEKAGCDNLGSPNVLFLPGFGVGSFHYEKQLKDLGRDFRVWALDFLGQGMSLPFEDPALLSKEGTASNGNISSWGFGDETEPWATKLVYSADLWQEQVRYFVEEVIGEPVYVVGNSLGGYVALYFAACNPHLVKGVTLLNATPFWGFLPNPIKSPRLAKIFPWAGTFPLPSNVKRLTMLLWEKVSDPKSIAQVLNQVYADHSTNVDNVFSRIVEITRHPAAAASFASIMCAPQGELSFSETLSRCRTNNVPICLMYGKEDPWVKPMWGLQVKNKVPEAPYYQISPAGHCPHDEVPEADEARKEVNSWADKKTNNLIKELLPPGYVDSLTCLVLANALYFKGAWNQKFDTSRTRDYDFHTLDGTSVKAPFMTSMEKQLIAAFNGFKVLGLPYKQSRDTRCFSMYIILPDAKDGLPTLVEKMASEPGFLERRLPLEKMEVGDFRIPRFKISFGFEAKNMLQKMGLVLPVLTEMVVEDNVYVSEIFHKSFIEVNEEGTEAAAATAVTPRKFLLFIFS